MNDQKYKLKGHLEWHEANDSFWYCAMPGYDLIVHNNLSRGWYGSINGNVAFTNEPSAYAVMVKLDEMILSQIAKAFLTPVK